MNGKYMVYMHVSPSGKKYVGITCRKNPNERWASGHGYPLNPHFSAAIKKYGWKNFEHKILASGLSKEDAERAEIKCIKHWDLRNPEKGYNISRGGFSPAKGWHHTAESKAKISKANSGKKRSKEICEIYSKAQRSYTHSPYTEYGYEAHCHVWKDNQKAVWCEELACVFESGRAASAVLNTSPSGISQCCNGRRRTSAGGYHFRWATEEEIYRANQSGTEQSMGGDGAA